MTQLWDCCCRTFERDVPDVRCKLPGGRSLGRKFALFQYHFGQGQHLSAELINWC